jgi:Holliday junction resolvase RusA-like endonuclease
MESFVSFFIPGKPTGKGRPRFTRQGHTYTPAITAAAEKMVASIASDAMIKAQRKPRISRCSVHIIATWPVPKSWTKQRQAAALSNDEIPGKPDLDNIAKLILDALNGVVYEDDVQVCMLTVTKLYGDTPGCAVIVR